MTFKRCREGLCYDTPWLPLIFWLVPRAVDPGIALALQSDKCLNSHFALPPPPSQPFDFKKVGTTHARTVVIKTFMLVNVCLFVDSVQATNFPETSCSQWSSFEKWLTCAISSISVVTGVAGALIWPQSVGTFGGWVTSVSSFTALVNVWNQAQKG